MDLVESPWRSFLKVIFKGRKYHIWQIFSLGWIFSFSLQHYCGILIGPQNVKLWYIATFWQFYPNKLSKFYNVCFQLYTVYWAWYWSTINIWILLKHLKGQFMGQKGHVWTIFTEFSILFSSTKFCPIISPYSFFKRDPDTALVD